MGRLAGADGWVAPEVGTVSGTSENGLYSNARNDPA